MRRVLRRLKSILLGTQPSAPAAAAPTRSPTPNFDRLSAGAGAFSARFEQLKADAAVPFPWYPYDTLSNVFHLAPLITPEVDAIFAGAKRFADIGAADGALAYYLESVGNQVDIYDFGPTNFNGMQASRKLKELFDSKVEINEVDLDAQFSLNGDYDFVFFLGILYHLKNPFYVLETLAKRVRYLAVSTRVVRHFVAGSTDVSSYAAAYLVGPAESNNDATNYWMFTNAGLKQIFDRAGWDVLSYHTVGDVTASNAQDPAHDERAFAILKSKR